MIKNKYNFILVIVLLLSFSTHPAEAQFFKKKKHAAEATDTSAVAKDTTAVVKDSLGGLQRKPVEVSDTTVTLKRPPPPKVIPPPPVQDTAFVPGDNQLSIAYGFIPLDGDVIRWVYQSSGGSSNFFGPIYLKYEHAMDYNWTLGVSIAYAHYDITDLSYYDNYGSDVPHQEHRSDDTYSLLARINYHFAMIKKWDPYLGAGFGVRTSSSVYTTSGNYPVAPNSWDNRFPVGFETTAGVRYVMSYNTCFYAELGIAKSLLQVGLTYKMKQR